MFFFLDTCFANHVRTLFKETQIDLRLLLYSYQIGITSAVKDEFEQFDIFDYFNKDNFYIIPINETELESFTKKNLTLNSFDLADRTLLLCAQRDLGIILTDDYDLMLEAYAMKINVFRLPAFLIFLLKNNQIEKKTVNKAFRYWSNTHRYKEKDLTKWKFQVHDINQK